MRVEKVTQSVTRGESSVYKKGCDYGVRWARFIYFEKYCQKNRGDFTAAITSCAFGLVVSLGIGNHYDIQGSVVQSTASTEIDYSFYLLGLCFVFI